MNTNYLVIGIIIIAVVAIAAYLATMPSPKEQGPTIGVGEEEINQLGQYDELALPEDIATEENLPNPEEEIVVDESVVEMPLPEDICVLFLFYLSQNVAEVRQTSLPLHLQEVEHPSHYLPRQHLARFEKSCKRIGNV